MSALWLQCQKYLSLIWHMCQITISVIIDHFSFLLAESCNTIQQPDLDKVSGVFNFSSDELVDGATH